MNISNKFFALFALVILLGFMVSCEDEEPDLENPVISINAPSDGATYMTGETIPFSATFSDDVDLSDYTITIEAAFDSTPIDKWTMEMEGSLLGKLELLEQDITVADNIAAGEYHLHVDAQDLDGKDATRQSVSIQITNSTDTQMPVLTINSPNPDLQLNLGAGDVFTISGDLTDNIGLHQLIIEIVDSADSAELLSNRFDLNGDTSYNFSENIPAPLNAGIYQVIITGVDGVNNRTQITIQLSVS